ncbi:MAG: DUF1207 domain-containing protein [Bacteroidota bacterium]
MREIKLLCTILLISAISTTTAFPEAYADSSSGNQFSFVPYGLLFKPLLANTYEPRDGILSEIGKNRLRLDIGNSIDLLQFHFDDDSSRLTMGADFFTYTLLRGEKDFHFPVDASDYFFGINFSYKKPLAVGVISSRLRVSHISSHFVDGHYDNSLQEWRDGQSPRVYSREFLDGVIAFEPSSFNNDARIYIGATYLYHVDPPNLARFMGDAGGEFHTNVWGKSYAYFAYQATALKILETSIRHNIQLGLKIGDWDGRGVNLYGSYFSGYSIHGEYFDAKDNYFALGFLIEF